MSIPPGTYTVTIDSFTKLEDKIIACYRGLGKTPTVILYDEYLDTFNAKGKRSLRNRHYQREAQPNCGPRKPNQW